MINKKRSTLKLIIIVGVILFVFFQIYKVAKNKVASQNVDDITTNMLVIQKKIKIINGNIKVNGAESIYVGKKLSELENEDIKGKAEQIGIKIEDFEKYYMLTMDDFESMGIKDELKDAADNKYAVNYENEDVVYFDGLVTNNKTQYYLSKVLNPEDDKDEKAEENKSDENANTEQQENTEDNGNSEENESNTEEIENEEEN